MSNEEIVRVFEEDEVDQVLYDLLTFNVLILFQDVVTKLRYLKPGDELSWGLLETSGLVRIEKEIQFSLENDWRKIYVVVPDFHISFYAIFFVIVDHLVDYIFFHVLGLGADGLFKYLKIVFRIWHQLIILH